jgi:uncharacterized protein
MLTFVGEGYTPAFTDNYRRIARRLSAGEEIEIGAGPDDICAPLLEHADPHCLEASVTERDAAARQSVSGIFGCEIHPDSVIDPDPDLLLRLRGNFASGNLRQACRGCEWDGLCSAIAADGYRSALVRRD